METKESALSELAEHLADAMLDAIKDHDWKVTGDNAPDPLPFELRERLAAACARTLDLEEVVTQFELGVVSDERDELEDAINAVRRAIQGQAE